MISAVFNKARKDWGWIDYVPPIRKFAEPKKRIRWLTPNEATRLLIELPTHLEAMARFSLMAGLHEANVTKLEWNQIDLQGKLLGFTQTKRNLEKELAYH